MALRVPTKQQGESELALMHIQKSTAIRCELLALFNVQSNASEPTIVFLELQFLPARSAQKYVIDITRLLANEERGFLFLLALGHFVRTYLQQKLRSWTFRNAYYG